MSCAAAAAGGSDGGDEQKKGKETQRDDSNEPYYIWLKEFSAMIESLDLEYNPASPLKRKSTSASSKLISHEYTSEDLEDPSVSRRKPQTDKMVKKGRSRKQPKYKKLSELGSGTTAASTEVAPPSRRCGRPKNPPDGRGQEDESREWRNAAVEIGDVEETEMEVEDDKEKEIQELLNKVDKGSPKN